MKTLTCAVARVYVVKPPGSVCLTDLLVFNLPLLPVLFFIDYLWFEVAVKTRAPEFKSNDFIGQTGMNIGASKLTVKTKSTYPSVIQNIHESKPICHR